MDAPAEARALASGTMLDDRYRIEHLLAVGGMGEVYVGTHVKLRKRVAIKVLNPALSTPAMVERFHREAITASQIGHEGIAQVTDLGTSQAGEPFLVMELLEGESLASRIKTSAPLPIEVACELGCAILWPLEAAHQAGIVHRDLKPDNVFLVRQSRGEVVKLLDFGISRASGLEGEFRLTTTGLVMGTPFYMSPEQARGDSEITTAADLYAFGVILYEMLVGTVPIQAENYNQLMYRVMMGEFEPPRRRRPDLPVELEQLILHAMASAAAQRPRSAAELEQSLLRFCRPTFAEHTIERLSGGRLSRPSVPPPARDSTPAVSSSPSGIERTLLATPTPPASPTPAPAAIISAPMLPASRRSRLPWVVASILVAGGVAATAIVLSSTRSSEPQPSAAPAPAATPVLPATAPLPAPPSPAPPPSTPPPADPDPVVAAAAAPDAVVLTFEVEPASARVTLDGKRVTGGKLEVQRDDEPHALRITAPGRIAHEGEIRFDQSQRMTIQLKPQRARVKPPARTGKRRGNTDHIDPSSPYQ